MEAKKFIDLEDKYNAHNYLPLDVVLTRGKGIWVYDVQGKKYLDFLSSYSALNQGHCHPKIIKAAKKQLSRLTLTSRAFYNDRLGLFLEKVIEISSMEMVLPMNSGAEAVETALKAARKWGYIKKGVAQNKAEIIVCKNNFSGRTITIISFTTEEQYKDGFGPLTPGFKIINYDDTAALKKAITDNTVAFLVEPIQGEGGIIVPSGGYLKAAHDICKKNNVLFMLDEIQTGLGRTGKMFAFQHEAGIDPDVIVMGKALSGGFYPVSCVAAKRKVLEVFNPGDHGSTFGGNPMAAVIGYAALEVLLKENLVDNAAVLGNYFINKLKEIKSKHIKEVRGRGLLIGIELHKEAGGARRFCEALKEEGLLCKETHAHVIRFAPPLVITRKDIDWAVDKVNRILTTL
jgi:ornithine--oxo-acid transaminase